MGTVLRMAILAGVGLCLFGGCEGPAGGEKLATAEAKRYLLSVDLRQGEILRYKFVSRRQIDIDFGVGRGKGQAGTETQKSTEQVEFVVSYEPVQVDALGFAAVRARCESVKAERVSLAGRHSAADPVLAAAGKSFVLKVAPSGLIEDASELEQLIKEVGKAAFGGDRSRAIKDADMIFDFIAAQWFLWDSVSSIKRPSEGVAVGQSWKSKLLVPLPVPLPTGRDVTYRLEQVTEGDGGQVAVIKSDYTLADRADPRWPLPYSGSFQMRGTFGFFRGYKVLSLTGGAEQLFDIDAGRIKTDRQQYEVQMSMVMPGGTNESAVGSLKPGITIRQEITAELLAD